MIVRLLKLLPNPASTQFCSHSPARHTPQGSLPTSLRTSKIRWIRFTVSQMPTSTPSSVINLIHLVYLSQ